MSGSIKNVRFSIDTFSDSKQPISSSSTLQSENIDDEVKDHPIFTQQNKSPLIQDILNQIRVNPKCTIINNIETGKKMTRFGARYWNLLLSINSDLALKLMKNEREEYNKQYSKK